MSDQKLYACNESMWSVALRYQALCPLVDFSGIVELRCMVASQVKTGDFILRSGERSDVFVDIRPLVLSQDLLRIVSEFAHLLFHIRTQGQAPWLYDMVYCGVPRGGTPIATGLTMLAGELGFSRRQITLTPRIEVNGLGFETDGELDATRPVVLIEDVSTTGGSVDRAAHALDVLGLKVVHVLSVVDRQPDRLDPIPRSCLFTLDEVRPSNPTR